MRFQTKMIYMYAVFMFVISIILGMVYYNYNITQNKKTEKANLKISADQLIVQCDEMIKPMELTMNYILSDKDMLQAIYLLSIQEDKILDSYALMARSELSVGLNTDFISNNFYRIIVFNQLGFVTSSKNVVDNVIKENVDYSNMPWLTKAEEQNGKPIIVNTHKDTWGLKLNSQVFSLVKAVQGKNMGYIEVQKKVDDLKKIIALPKENMKYIIYVNGDEQLYSDISGDAPSHYSEIVEQEGEFVRSYRSADNEEMLVAKSKSDKYNISVLVIEAGEALHQQNRYIILITILIAGIFLAVSMFFVIMLSYFLTKPIRQLRTVMEKTEIDNLDDEVDLSTTNDEITALSNSYQDVLERLRQSLLKEKHMSLLQLQAQFDLLQSQVNPHFLYNVLNVIAARGTSNQDEQICEICGSLANMLRYSTNTKTQYATIKEELEYLDQYFYILKARFEHKISFEVQVEDSVLDQVIPKITLQQIVENCINHGFENSTKQMEVVITGGRIEAANPTEEMNSGARGTLPATQEKWFIRIHDNGQGFSEESLRLLREKLIETKNSLLKEKRNMKLEIGGMGLVNTYARLLLLYQEGLDFEIRNVAEGADVIITVANPGIHSTIHPAINTTVHHTLDGMIHSTHNSTILGKEETDV